jgi:hypothetical protein
MLIKSAINLTFIEWREHHTSSYVIFISTQNYVQKNELKPAGYVLKIKNLLEMQSSTTERI